MASKWFSSAFAPTVRPRFVNTDQVILLLFHRVVLFKDLPEDVAEAVSKRMQEKTKSSSNNATVEDEQ